MAKEFITSIKKTSNQKSKTKAKQMKNKIINEKGAYSEAAIFQLFGFFFFFVSFLFFLFWVDPFARPPGFTQKQKGKKMWHKNLILVQNISSQKKPNFHQRIMLLCCVCCVCVVCVCVCFFFFFFFAQDFFLCGKKS